MFFGEVAQEHLLDLEAAGIPPGEADQKCISAGAAGQAGGFCVEEEPFVGICKGRASTAADGFVAGAR